MGATKYAENGQINEHQSQKKHFTNVFSQPE
jgi:hypothetical protein